MKVRRVSFTEDRTQSWLLQHRSNLTSSFLKFRHGTLLPVPWIQ